ncbi:hypothetical protein WU39_13280 [Bordetella pertussis]|nr:hypothetical protein WU05_06420 [Bordetella pertussis]AQC39836.1 hypothetical protein WU39_13280 [Bordetella pertussis]
MVSVASLMPTTAMSGRCRRVGASEASRAAVSLAATGGPARPAGAGGRLSSQAPKPPSESSRRGSAAWRRRRLNMIGVLRGGGVSRQVQRYHCQGYGSMVPCGGRFR